MNQSAPNVWQYLKGNPVAWFIIALIISLLISTYLLIRGITEWANELGIIAYFLLVIVVVLQLKSFLKNRMHEEEESVS